MNLAEFFDAVRGSAASLGRSWWALRYASSAAGNKRRNATRKRWQRLQNMGLRVSIDENGKECGFEKIWQKNLPEIEANRKKERRQRVRAALRRKCFVDITQEFGGESRRQRRAIALSLAQRMYRQIEGLAYKQKGAPCIS